MFRTTIAVAVLSITAGAAFAEPPQVTLRPAALRQIPTAANPALTGIKVFTGASKQNVQANPDAMPSRIKTGVSRGAGAKFQQVVSATKGASGPITVTAAQPYVKDIAQVTVSANGGQLYSDMESNFIELRGSNDSYKRAHVVEHFIVEPGHTYLIDTNVSVYGGSNCKITLRSPAQEDFITPCVGNNEQQHIVVAYKQDIPLTAWGSLSMMASEGATVRFWSFTVTRLD